MLKPKNSDWYKNIWTLDIKNESWVEDTESQVDFIIKTLELTGKERILDLACGFGRHCLSFTKRGYPVVGVDITKDYIDDAKKTARELSLPVDFICADIRDISFYDEFDVVLSLADGAIGYLENDEENLKIFDKIAAALKTGGKHFMDVINAEHAELCFPSLGWEIGEKALALSLCEWDAENRKIIYAGWNVPYGVPAEKPVFSEGDSYRIYTKDELQDIFAQRHMRITDTFSNYYGKKDSPQELQLIIYSQKEYLH
jgi:2-polyprenyl-3-methyl-5-hydroxy-6-metoxy-1,4-benzoquinol methylase